MRTRRDFLRNTLLGAVATALPSLPAADLAKRQYCYFTKHLQGLSFDQIADITAELGMNGVEAPIRPKGQVEPERVEEDLPLYVEALKKRDLSIMIMTSGINSVNADQKTEKVLRTAKVLGIPQYRMLYRKYDLSKPIWPQVESWRSEFKDVIAMSKDIGIQPLYQNHSGKDYFGAPVWDVYELMRDYSPQDWSFAFDIYHATVEGGMSWPLELNLVRDRIGMAYFKNFKWGEKKAEACPLGEGVVKKDCVAAYKKINYTGPISLHIEYLEGDTKDPAYVKKAVDATKRDFALLKEWWA